MSKNLEGKKSPNFSGECTSETKFKLSELNKNLVLYFYPKDSTPGCTTAVSYTHLTLPTIA